MEKTKRMAKGLRGKNLRSLDYRHPPKKTVSSCSTVVVSLMDGSKKVSWESVGEGEAKGRKEKASVVVSLPARREGTATKGTQTDYRESEAQTGPWRHEVKAEESALQELLSLDWLTSEKHFPIGMSEVRRIEVVRRQLAWEEVVRRLRGAANEGRRRALVMMTAEAAAEEKGRRREEEERERMEMVQREMKATREEEERTLQWKMARAYGWRSAENEAKIGYWQHQLTRRIRKMKSARNQSAKKLDIVTVHKDKASDIYAPKLRDGENPSLRHEVIDIQCRYLKRYHGESRCAVPQLRTLSFVTRTPGFPGLEILEKHLALALEKRPEKLSRPRFRPQTRVLYSRSKSRELCARKFRERAIEKPREMSFSGRSVRIPVPPPSPGDSIPPGATRPLSEPEEALELASLLLQRLIRGRAVQTAKLMQIFKMAST